MPEPAAPAPAGGLIERIAAGDPRAEAELVERFGEGLLFLLRRWTRDPGAADDLYQETLRLALQKIRQGEVREPDRLAAFLRALARNLSIHHYRRGAVREGRERPFEPERLEGAAPEAVAEGPLQRLLRSEKAGLVRRLIEELGVERDRQVLLRFYIREEEKERICADLGLSGKDFNVVLFRARQRYRKLYEERLGPGPG
jgi:RNA polymerase sigma-70 factor (ECF subfamily)